MTVKNGINQIGVLVGGGPAPKINSVIHAITGEAVRHHKAVIGLYNGFKCLMKENLVNIRLTQDVVGYIYLEGGSILRSARANPTKSPKTLRKVATPLQNVGINQRPKSSGRNDTAYFSSQAATSMPKESWVSTCVPLKIFNYGKNDPHLIVW